ncbi:MAG: flagellar biosynthetic protein FliO [Deltaproteobacteria bacterium]|nr:flagellar biosynthetic protein FliO [Deltaproteobacteria bacterium]
MRTFFALVLAATLAVTATTAHAADDRWAIVDHGDQVEVIVHGAIAAGATAAAVRERVEIPVASMAVDLERFPKDATVREIDIRGHAPRVLSIKLHLDRAQVKALAPLVRITQTGDDMHVLIPRALPTAAATTAPAPMIGPMGPIAIAPINIAPPDLGPTATVAAAPAKPAIDTGHASLATGATAPAPAASATQVAIGPSPAPAAPAAAPPPAAPAAPADATPPALAPRVDSSLQLPTLPIVTVLGAGGLALAALLRRRKKNASTVQDLDVVASRSLGGKAKIVWLAAGEREIVVSVTNQQVRLLSQWRRTRATGAPEARALPPGESRRTPPAFAPQPAFAAALSSASNAIALDDDDGVEFAPITPVAPPAPPPRAPRPSSPPVSGIHNQAMRGKR